MAKQEAFTTDEWTLLRLAPAYVASGTSAADPSGLFSSLKESFAGAKGMLEAFRSNSSLELFSALAADRSLPGVPDAKTVLGEGPREQQMQNLKTAVLEKAKAAIELVGRKASPAEADAYRAMMVNVAEKAASASSEGGFLGFGGVRVSDKEKAFITEVKRAIGMG
ncbi:MAG TPA: hypothetical protein VFD38_00545 [Myxococcaceae bacterium]|nr:hypothetical protein [Myxococcaceae bacterium]